MKNNFFSTYCLLFLITLSTFSLAQESVQVIPNRTKILIGEQIVLDLKINGKPNVEYLFPNREDTLMKGIELLEVSPTDTVENEGTISYLQQWKLTSFDTGRYLVPELAFQILHDSASLDTLNSVSFMIEVGTVKVDTTQPIKPIHDIWSVPEYPKDNTWFYVIASSLIFIGVILFFLFKYLKNKNKDVTIEKKKPSEPAHIYALKKIEELKVKNLWQQNKFKEYHSELTEIVRTYIEMRYNIDALEKTTNEVLEIIRGSTVMNSGVIENLSQVLTLADMVKFAKRIPIPEENMRSMELAEDLIQKTKLISENTDA